MAENAQALQAAGLRRGAAERLDASASAVRGGATTMRYCSLADDVYAVHLRAALAP